MSPADHRSHLGWTWQAYVYVKPGRYQRPLFRVFAIKQCHIISLTESTESVDHAALEYCLH